MERGALVLLVFLFLLLPMISAEPPFTEQKGGGLVIEFPKIDILQANISHDFHFNVFNDTNFISNSTGQCGFTMIIPNGSVIYKNQKINYFQDSENDWQITLLKGNFTIPGQYSYAAECNTTSQIGLISAGFLVTQTGLDPSISEAVIYWLSFFGMLIIFFLSMYFSIVLPYRNTRADDGKIMSVNKLKYAKLGFILMSYALFNWILNLLLGLSTFLSLTMYQGLFSNMFLLFTKMSWPFTIVWAIIFLLTLKNDAKIGQLLKRGFKPR